MSSKLIWQLIWLKLGFDVEDLSEEAPDDLEGLDAAAAHVANLLSTEPADSKFLFQICSTFRDKKVLYVCHSLSV